MTPRVIPLLLLLPAAFCRAGQAPADTVRAVADTLAAPADTTGVVEIPGQPAAADTVRRIRVPSFSGSPGLGTDSALMVARHEKYWRPHRSLGGVLAELPGVWFLDQSSEGQYSALAPRGSDWRALAVLRDGRSMADPGSGVANLWYLSVEEGETVELVTGPRSFLYGFNGAGGALNVVSRMDNSNRPVSRISYQESGYEHTRADGAFAQNVSRNVNLAGGFQALSTDGRFANSPHDQWNARGRVRVSPSDDLHVALSYSFLSARTGLNGGVDADASGPLRSYDPLRAVVVNSDAYEKTTRNEAEARIFGSVTGDSTTLSVLTLYYVHQLREYRDEENRAEPNGLFIQDDHTTSWMGGSFRQEWTGWGVRLRAGGEMELRQVEGSPTMGRRRNSAGAAWGIAEVPVGAWLTAAGFVRYESARGESFTGYGADLTAALPGDLRLTGGVSSASRLPTYQELFWQSADVRRTATPTGERHIQAELRADLRVADAGSARIALFRRIIHDPIRILPGDSTIVFPPLVFTQGTRRITSGMEAAADWRLWLLTLEATALYIEHTDDDAGNLRDFPAWSGSAGVFFRNRVLADALDIKVGFRGRYISAHAGSRFNPEVIAYVPNTGPDIPEGAAVDFQLFARIGDAYIHFLWENLSDQQFMSTAHYPLFGRQITFGIAWEFLD